MAALVVNRDSISVKLESDHLVVHDHAKEVASRRVPLMDVDRVVVVGNPAISFHVLARLMDRGVPCSFLTHSGKWRGVMDGDAGFHAQRRIHQYERVADAEFSLRLSRQLIAAKIANSRRTVQRLAAERRIDLRHDFRTPLSEDLSVEGRTESGNNSVLFPSFLYDGLSEGSISWRGIKNARFGYSSTIAHGNRTCTIFRHS